MWRSWPRRIMRGAARRIKTGLNNAGGLRQEDRRVQDAKNELSLAGRRVWVAGHRGMVGAALTRALAREDVHC